MAQRNGSTQTKGRSQEVNRPFKEFRSSGLKATIWANETSNGRMFNTQLVRVYREENGDWKETTSLGQADLLVGARLLEMAFTVIMQAEETERQRQQQAA